MGKGDKKTRRGKIVIGSHGKLRPRKKEKQLVTVAKAKVEKPKVEKPAVKAKKVKAKE
ncbi:MAG: 30S ribosomal protein THX [Flavobacteriaceae bacterium]|nr:30S ribosomal protein THX [Flavobacteriaceae bacterium]